MNSLATRLFAAFCAVIVLVSVIVSLTLIILLRGHPLLQRQGMARLYELSSAALRPGQPVTNALAAELAAAHDVRVLLTLVNGEVVFDTQAEAAPPLRLRSFRAGRRDAAFPDSVVGQVRDARLQPWLFVARPAGGERLLVSAARPVRFSVLEFFREDLLVPMLQAAGLALGVAALLAIVLTRSVTLPLQKMAAVAQGIARGHYAHSAPVTGPDEVRALGQSLNSMARQVQHSQQAQRDFLVNVSHELKTPLTSIQGFAQAMLDGAVATPEAVQRSAQIIYAESDRLRRMVAGLLDMERLDPLALQRAPLDLGALLPAVVERFSLRAREKSVALGLALPAGLPMVHGDADRLGQVFGNLIDNALIHTPAGGQDTVSAAAVPAGVAVTVADTGTGIPPADLPRIFERFYQVDKARVRAGGVGLGLAISHEIVAAHGGTLGVESVVGEGSRFTVRLPGF